MPRKKTFSDEDLLKAARQVFVERGFAGSTRDIAARAGVSEGLLFRRYRTKADLFFAAMVPPPIAVSEQLRQTHAADRLPPAIERLTLDMLEYFRAAVPVLLPLMSHPDFHFEEFARRHPDSALVVLRSQLVEFFAANRTRDPSADSLVLIALAHGIAMFEHLGAHGGRFPRQIVERAITCMWRGMDPAR